MELQQFEQETNEKWRGSMFRVTSWITALVFVAEIIIFFYFKAENRIESTEIEYILRRIVAPTSVNLMILFVMFLMRRSQKEQIQERIDEWMCYGLFGVCASIAIVHNFYHVTWVIPGLCQFVNAIYIRSRITHRTFLYALAICTITAIVAYMEEDPEYDHAYIMVSLASSYAFNYAVYLAAKVMSAYHREQQQYVRETYERQKQLIEEIDLDGLTGLLHKKCMEKKLQDLDRDNTFVVMLDLDFFKNVNDTYGHVNGDKVLRFLADCIRKYSSENLLAFRYGGEEFSMLCNAENSQSVLKVLSALQRMMYVHEFDFDTNLHITFSGGVTKIQKEESLEHAISRADEALYEAKHRGRNRVEVG